jgi:hypothetical protein
MKTETDPLKWPAVNAAFALCAFLENNPCQSKSAKDAVADFLDACAEDEKESEFKAKYQMRAAKMREGVL